MPSHVLIKLLLWAVALNAGLLLLLMWRRGLGGRLGYAGLLLADLLLAAYLIGARMEGHPLAVVCIGAFLFLVVVPSALRGITSWAVQRGRFGVAMRLTSLREMLQPGAGVGQERELLEVVQQLQTGDTGELLERLRQRAAAETDPELAGLLHEQCLTLMAVERRWDDAVEHATSYVTPHLIAQRPRLGAAMLRVYGEVGDIEGLVRTMYLVEGGEGATRPENADVLEHCRIMVLAFVGEAEALLELIGPGRRTRVEPKVRHFWLGVAHHQAGEKEPAREHYAEALARLGPEDERARATIQQRQAALEARCEPVLIPDPDQTRRLVEAIRERAARTLARPRMRAQGWRHAPATVGLVVVNVVIFAAMELVGGGSEDPATLIRSGASLTHAVQAGEYWRLASAMFLHANWLHVAVNVFMLWFLGRFAEQLLGSLRFFVVYFAAGVLGNVASHLWRAGPLSVGASSSLFGILGATLAALLLSRGRVPEAWRRTMVLMIALVIGLNFLPGLSIKVIDNYAHLGGLVGGLLFGALLYRTGSSGPGRWLAKGLGLACVAALGYCVYGLLTSNLGGLPWAESRGGGLVARHPVTWFADPSKDDKLELVDLMNGDQVIAKKMGPAELGSLPALLERRWQEYGASSSRSSSGRRVVLHRLPARGFSPGWVWFRRDVRQADGRRFVEVRAFGLHGAPPDRQEWQALLVTAKKRFDETLAVYRRILTRLRAAP